jgi:polyferredoxin
MHGMASVATGPDGTVRAQAAAGEIGRFDRLLAQTGDWMMRHQRMIRRVQWGVVLVYALLIVVPAVLPLPPKGAHLWTNLTLFAQFAFWGIWWPFVLVSMVLVGRLWCGLLCPEGALSEAVADHGRGLAVPRWLQWKGWPFVAFACTTVYGQMTSVYQYPRPALVVLGGSTAAAMVVGYLWGRHKRVWCRFLCPVTGVFSLLSKLAPFHFASIQPPGMPGRSRAAAIPPP